MNYIDYIIIGILLIYILIGYFKGFMFSLLSLFSFGVKFVLSMFLCKPFMLFTNNVCKLDIGLSNALASSFTKTSNLFDVSMETMNQTEINNHITECLNTTKYPSFLKSFLKNIFQITEGNSNFTFNSIISKTFGTFFSFIISFIIIFIIVCILVYFIKYRFKKLTEQSVTVKRIDRFMGIAYGFVGGVINIVIVISVLSWFKNFSFLSSFFESLQSSFLGGLATQIIYPFMDKYLNLKEIAKWFINLL